MNIIEALRKTVYYVNNVTSNIKYLVLDYS